MTKAQLRKAVCVVHQNPYMNSSENIRNNLLGFNAELDENRPSDAKLREVLDKATLESINLDDPASVLSGGQVQLLSIAQAMLNPNDSKILLMDEPTSHID